MLFPENEKLISDDIGEEPRVPGSPNIVAHLEADISHQFLVVIPAPYLLFICRH